MTEPSDPYPGFFWPLVIVGSAAILFGEWWLSRSDYAWLLDGAFVVFLSVLPIVIVILLVRIGHPLLASISVAAPLTIVLAFTGASHPSGIVWLVVYVAAIGFFVQFTSSAKLVGWWYRVVLQSRLRPPDVE